jgi:putative restriction endonuclease
MELSEHDNGDGQIIALSPELTFHFLSFWKVVAHRRTQRPDIRLPFYHLSGDGIWTPLRRDGTAASGRKDCVVVQPAPQVMECLRCPTFRATARELLVRTYFPADEQTALFAVLGMSPPSGSDAVSEVPSSAAVERGREARFRLTVIPAYSYRCALTGYRLTTLRAGCIVDAAHIHRFSDSRNNDPTNGIALSKNAHWLFDNGLWTIDESYKVRVAKGAFVEDGPQGMLLSYYDSAQIWLPERADLRPNQRLLDWHRSKVFVGD